MTKEELHTLLRSPYTQTGWRNIVNAIFPNRDFFSSEQDVPRNTQAQRDKAERIVKFGNILLDDGNELALYEVELKPTEINISKNRVGLRNLLNAEIIPGVVDGALIVYHQKGQVDWRFSFFSKTKYWDADGNEVRKETNPKRYTYVLGKGETCVTPRERFWLLAEKQKRTIKDVLEAFSVEKVSGEFFAKYKKCYQAFVEELTRKDNHIANQIFGVSAQAIAGNEGKIVRDFAKKMLGRLVFLQLLQKKGWLDVPVNEDYGKGNKNFLAEFFDAHKNDAFYSTCLVPLFFETLNNPKDEIFKVTGTKFPYLNGGLFERDEIEKKAKADFLVFPPELFQRLFDFFGEYNFTIDENTPDDLDVGIDPEMLGHIFENLLEDNREKGAFYTPKIFVQYMCQEVLIQYLEIHLGKHEAIERFIRYKELGGEKSKDNFIRKHATQIEKLLDNVKICDPAIGSGAFPMGLLQEIFQAKMALDMTLIDLKGEVKRQIIQNSIYGVDKERGAVDIARLRFWLSLIVDEEVKPGEKPQPLPNFDYKIMQGDSLFESFKGYSLKYHEEPQEQQHVDLFNTQSQINIFQHTHNDLAALEKEFFDPRNNHKKEAIRAKIDQLVAYSIEQSFKDQIADKKHSIQSIRKNLSIQKPKKARQEKNIAQLEQDVEQMQTVLKEIKPLLKKDEKPWFMWHLFFKDVFDAGGFDIVIGNPPYIRQESITAIKPYLEKVDGKINYEVYNSTSDIYTYFFELGHKLLKPDKGVLSYICSKKYTRAKYGQNLRKYLLKNTRITGYVDFNEVQIFGATVDTSIIILQSSSFARNTIYDFPLCIVSNDVSKNEPLVDYFKIHGTAFNSSDLMSESWSFVDMKSVTVKKLIEKTTKKLKDYNLQINYGIKTGYNEAFVINENQRQELLKKEPDFAAFIKPMLRGRDIGKYKITHSNQWLLFIPWHFPLHEVPSIKGASTEAEIAFKEIYPNAYAHFVHHKKLLSQRNKAETGIRYEWYALQRCASTYYRDFDKEKIVWLIISEGAKFSLDKSGAFVNNAAFILTGQYIKYLLAVLNSKSCEWYYDKITNSSGVGTNKWEKIYVEQIPIPEIPESEMRPFEILVDYITFIKKDDTRRINPYTTNAHMATNFEELLDACVYELYFGEHMRERGIAVLDDVRQLLRPIDQFDEETEADKIAEAINAVYDIYKSPGNPIRQRIDSFPAQSPDIINVIQHG